MIPETQFAWNLTSLSTGDAIERALQDTARRAKATQKPTPAPTGSTEKETPASLVVITMMGILERVELLRSRLNYRGLNYRGLNISSQFLYAAALILCVCLSFVTLAFPGWFDLGMMDWFSFTSWSALALSEFIFIVIRIVGNAGGFGSEKSDAEPMEIDLVNMVLQPFVPAKNPLASVFVAFLHAFTSGFVLFGLLVVHMQMMLDADNPSHVQSVPYEHRYAWTAGWTAGYLFIVLSFGLAALLDPNRLGKLDPAIADWLIELVAWRVVLLGMFMPVIGIGFATYANVCCPGDWILT